MESLIYRATLTKHSRSHTDTRRYGCVTCGKRFLDKQTLDEHGVTHLQRNTDVTQPLAHRHAAVRLCDVRQALTRVSRLRMHVRAHEEELAPTLLLVCKICCRAFRDGQDAQGLQRRTARTGLTRVSRLRMHVRAHEEELAPTLLLVCKLCCRAFRDGQDAQVRRADEDLRTDSRVPSAHARLTRVSRLRMHVRTHEEELAPTLLLVCKICCRAFRDGQDAHVFYVEEGLNNHRAIHKGVKNPFTIPCRDCNEVLPNKTALYKHRKKEHSGVSVQGLNSGVATGAFCATTQGE
ncbi:putative regulation of transcription, partial [Operophtera brumata]